MALTKQDVAKLYVALFDRAPEGQALNYWFLNSIENNWDLSTLAQAMLDGAKAYIKTHPEAQEIYPQYANLDETNSDSVKNVIDTVYKILFNKDSSTDPQGVQHWVDDVTKNGISLGKTIANIVISAEEYLNSDNTNAKKAAKAFENKIDVALEVADKFKEFDGEFSEFQKFIKIVTDDDTSVENAKELVNIYAPKEILLSTGSNDVKGGLGNDKFYGLIDNNNSDNTTLKNYDKLDGNDGKDTLYVRMNLADGNATTQTIDSEIKNIETFNINVFSEDNVNDEVDIDNDSFPGLKNIIISNDNSVTAGDVLYKIDNFVSDGIVEINGGKAGADIEINYKDVSAKNDEKSIKLENGIVNNLTINGVETIDIISNGQKNVINSIKDDSVKTINVSGYGDIELKDLNNNSVEELNAVDLKGNVTFGSEISTIDDDTKIVKGGNGNDVFYFTNSNIESDNIIDGGNGEDIVYLIGGTNDNDKVIKNVEVLGINDSNGDVWDLSDLSGTKLSKVLIKADGNIGGNLTISNIEDEEIEFNNSDTNGNSLTLNSKDGIDSVKLNVVIGTDTINGADIDNIDVNSNIKTLNISVSDPKHLLKKGETENIKNIDVENVILNSDVNTNVTFENNVTKIFNAKNSNGNIIVDGSNGYINSETHEGMEIITGKGDDRVIGTSENDKIRTGSGDDIVYVTYGQLTKDDEIDMGDGDDILYFNGIVNGDDIDLSGSNADKLSNVVNVEKIGIDLSALANGESADLSIDDASLSVANNNLSLIIKTSNNVDGDSVSVNIDASDVVLDNGIISMDLSDKNVFESDDKLIYKGGNAVEHIIGGDGNDIFEYQTTSYLSSSDKIDGKGGVNILKLSKAGSGDENISAEQLSGIKNIQTIEVEIDNDSDKTKSVVINENVAKAMAGDDGVLNIVTSDSGADANANVKFDGSLVGNDVSLSLVGGSEDDILIGGNGDDVIRGDLGNDDMKGGLGKDVFVLDGGIDNVEDFNFGGNSIATDVDKLKISGLTFNGGFDKIVFETSDPDDGTVTDDDIDVIVYQFKTYGTIDDVDTQIENDFGIADATGDDMIVIWQDDLDNVHISKAIGSAGEDNSADGDDEWTLIDLAKLKGISIDDLSSDNLDLDDFIIS